MDWKYLVGALGASAAWIWSVYTWYRSQAAQRSQSEYIRKEILYRDLLRTLIVIYKGGQQAGAEAFLEQYRLAWLYAPDNVVKTLDRLMTALTINPSELSMPPDQLRQIQQARDAKGKEALSALVAAIRKDLFDTVGKRTEIEAENFGHYS